MKSRAFVKDVVLAALATAVLAGGKEALAVIPNVEVVTLFIMLFACTMKPQVAFAATVIFNVIECVLWGLGTWVITYVIHWDFLCAATYLFSNVLKIKNRWFYFAFVILATVAFGVLSSLVDTVISVQKSGLDFWFLFKVIYVRGVWFYVVHIVSNAAINLVLFAPMRKLLSKLVASYYGGVLPL